MYISLYIYLNFIMLNALLNNILTTCRMLNKVITPVMIINKSILWKNIFFQKEIDKN